MYKHIYRLQRAGIPVKPYISKFLQIEKTEKNKQNIAPLVSELNNSLIEADATITKPIESNINNQELVNSLEQAWQQAKDNEAAALKAVEDAEQERKDITLPDAYDMDAQARYENNSEALQTKIDAALATWHQAAHDRDAAYNELLKAKEGSL